MIRMFDSHVREFIRQIAESDYDTVKIRWMCTGMCGCLGPQGDEPFCPCRMRHNTVEIVENLRKNLIKNKLEELQNAIRELER